MRLIGTNRRGRPWLVFVAILVAALAGCSGGEDNAVGQGDQAGGGDDLTTGVVAAVDGADLLIACAGHELSLRSLNDVPLASEVDIAEGALSVIDEFLVTGEGDFWPGGGFWALQNTATDVLLAHQDPTAGVTLLGARLSDGAWRNTAIQSGGDGCTLAPMLPDRTGEVRWRLDPDQPVDPNDTELAVLATGVDCSSGQPMGDRLQKPQVALTERTIFVVLVADFPEGDQTCPGNPEEALLVDVGEPIGDREILDGRQALGTLGDLLPPSPCGFVIGNGAGGPPEREPCP